MGLLAALALLATGCGSSKSDEEATDKLNELLMKDLKAAADSMKIVPRPTASKRPQDIALCNALNECMDGCLPEVKRLLTDEKADPNCFCEVMQYQENSSLLNKIPGIKDHVKDGDFEPIVTDAITLALAAENPKILDALVQHGANLNGGNGHNPPLVGAIYVDDLKAVDRLVKLGADPATLTSFQPQSKAMTKKLLDLGAPASAVGVKNAAFLHDQGLFDYLLSVNPAPKDTLTSFDIPLAGFDSDNFLNHVLDMAEQPGYSIPIDGNSFAEHVFPFGNCAILTRMKPHGLNFAKIEDAARLVNDAVFHDDLDMLRCLLDLGAPTHDENTFPLEMAIMRKETEMVRLLKERGARTRDGDDLKLANFYNAPPEIIAILSKK